MKKSLVASIVLAMTMAAACKGAPPAPASPAAKASGLQSEDDKTLYALGLLLGKNLTALNLAPGEWEIVKSGMADMVAGKKPEVDLATYAPKLQQFAQSRAAAAAQAEKGRAPVFLEAAGKEPGAVTLPSGLVFRTLKPGAGAAPTAKSVVKVHYHGTLTDGTVFDSSRQRGPLEIPLGDVIPCWTEGVQKMKVGETAKLVCPSTIAYGDQGRPPTIPGGATLVFEIELLDIKK